MGCPYAHITHPGVIIAKRIHSILDAMEFLFVFLGERILPLGLELFELRIKFFVRHFPLLFG
jgi:hypothetical protein